MKPSIFIASSKEALKLARAFRQQLKNTADVTIWDEGIFKIGENNLASLINAVDQFDFALIIFSSEDKIISRSVVSHAVRDNLLFELGLFMGHLGSQRTLVALDLTTSPKTPSDLTGITFATFKSERADGNITAAVGTAADPIRERIEELGPLRNQKTDPITNSKNISKVNKEPLIGTQWNFLGIRGQKINEFSFLGNGRVKCEHSYETASWQRLSENTILFGYGNGKGYIKFTIDEDQEKMFGNHPDGRPRNLKKLK